MFKITKEFTFSAAHQLEHLPTDHQCSRLHGHNYTVKVELQRAWLDFDGFVVDYGELGALKTYIDQELEHRNLNDVLPFYTTAENIARHLFLWCEQRWPEVTAVAVSETAKTWAEYRP